MFRIQAVQKKSSNMGRDRKPTRDSSRQMRADARIKLTKLLQAAMDVFLKSGVDAPVREIAERAGVGIGTVYRHFPQRSDLIVAVFKTQVDACAIAAEALARKYAPDEALARWVQHYVDFITTKRGLAAALHSGDAAYQELPTYFDECLRPALQSLLASALNAKAVRPGIDADDLLRAIAALCRERRGGEPMYARKMVDLLLDGLRYRANGTGGTF